MNFWTGFFAGIVASYAICGALAVALCWPRKGRQVNQAEKQPEFCPEYPDVQFTHFTNIADAVRGYDD